MTPPPAIHGHARTALAAAAATACIGTAARQLLYGGPVFSWLFLEADWTEYWSLRLERAGSFALLALAPLLFWPRARAAAAFASLWLLLVALCTMAMASRHAAFNVPAQATRWLAPVALLLPLAARVPAQWVLRAAAAAVFAAHGMEALLGEPLFVDYLLGLPGGGTLGQERAEALLRLIGGADLLAAGCILLPKPIRLCAAWMALWGLATALLRLSFGGWGAWPETAARLSNGLVPLALWLLWNPRQKDVPC